MYYHINYDGKVLPCRAYVKKCPYGAERHSSSPTDLYMKYQDTYTGNLTPDNAKEKLESGEPFNFNMIDKAIAQSDTPCELICSTLRTAYKNAGKGNIPRKDEVAWNEGVYKVKTLLEAGHRPPLRIPDEMVDEARSQMTNTFLDAISHIDERRNAMDGSWDYLVKNTRNINRINKLRHEHPQMSKQDIRDYKKDIVFWYQHYANLLNTRKLISQPAVHYKDSQGLVKTFDKMSTEDLQSLYDDCTVSAYEIRDQLKTVHNFDTQGNTELSDDANHSINRWINRSRRILDLYSVATTERVVIALSAANVLRKRGALFEDV